MNPWKIVVVSAGLAASTFSLAESASAQATVRTTGSLRPTAEQIALEREKAKAEEEAKSARAEANQASAESEPTNEQAPKQARRPAADKRDRIDLICYGGGISYEDDTRRLSGSYSGDFGSTGGSIRGTISGTRAEDFADQVTLHIEGGEGRLRMPSQLSSTLLAKLFRGDKSDWHKLKNIEYSPGEITANVAVGLLNKPRMRLDRYSGAISISGADGGYTGQCARFDPREVERKF